MRLKPPDLSSFIRAKPLVSPSNPAKASIKSADLINNLSPSKVPVPEHINDSLLKHISSKPDQAAAQIKALIQSLGLPQDTLSSTIISFFRNFGLSLDAQALKNIRREVLGSKTSKDSAALAASAAFDKGVSLSDEALKEYAAAIDPMGHKSSFQDSGGAGFGQTPQDNQEKGDKKNDRDTPLPEDIKNLMEDIDTSGSLLGYMNKIPGKNGQFWIILPFNFTSGTREFSVSVRILVYISNSHYLVERLTLDAAVNERRWFLVLSKAQDGSYTGQAGVSPGFSQAEQSALIAELKELLGDFVSEISLMDENEIKSFIDSRNDTLISVDEEV